jgi:hypothetical protein
MVSDGRVLSLRPLPAILAVVAGRSDGRVNSTLVGRWRPDWVILEADIQRGGL